MIGGEGGVLVSGEDTEEIWVFLCLQTDRTSCAETVLKLVRKKASWRATSMEGIRHDSGQHGDVQGACIRIETWHWRSPWSGWHAAPHRGKLSGRMSSRLAMGPFIWP
ncbi:hypothetical protein GWK47_014273 [Chionoecetes opilio]|uniref:Uncharacterized protein n=1 Tax=Chionoecetes opilio TaxID=41210 RepID=A0A8J4Y3V5_CHIOP|nr:hypothetical protein GWK47_014273 [Chionoecetes opilio]